LTTEHYETCHYCGGLVLERAMYCSHCTTRRPLALHPLESIAAPLTVLAAPFVKLALFGIRQLWRRHDRQAKVRTTHRLHT
jgi:hypothetical protein